MRLYLGGPMRGHEDHNHPAFHAAAAQLRALGHEVYNPAERDTVPLGGHETAEARAALRSCMAAGLAWICEHSEGMVILPYSLISRGTQAEMAAHRAIGLPVWELAEVLDAPPPCDFPCDDDCDVECHQEHTVIWRRDPSLCNCPPGRQAKQRTLEGS